MATDTAPDRAVAMPLGGPEDLGLEYLSLALDQAEHALVEVRAGRLNRADEHLKQARSLAGIGGAVLRSLGVGARPGARSGGTSSGRITRTGRGAGPSPQTATS